MGGRVEKSSSTPATIGDHAWNLGHEYLVLIVDIDHHDGGEFRGVAAGSNGAVG